MDKNESGRPVGFRRPPKLIKVRDKDTISPPDLSTIISKPGEKVAYLSVPSSWSVEIHAQILQRVRTDLPDLSVESFMTAFTLSELLVEPPIWRELIQDFITGADLLIVATDSTLIVGVGIKEEIKMALRARKKIILFDVTKGCCRRFLGFDPVEGRSIRLRERPLTNEEWEERKRLRLKRGRKREKERRRLERRRLESEKWGSNAV
jgi:hypothetical protein